MVLVVSGSGVNKSNRNDEFLQLAASHASGDIMDCNSAIGTIRVRLNDEV